MRGPARDDNELIFRLKIGDEKAMNDFFATKTLREILIS
jgi:hypothetical protein